MTQQTIEAIIKDQTLSTLTGDATIAEAAALMRTRNIRSILIVDGDTLLGIFTDTDANRLTSMSGKAGVQRLDEVMTPSPVTITKSTSPSEALGVMARGGFKHLPVVENGKLIGVVSRRDFF